jgi:hypothetical protein
MYNAIRQACCTVFLILCVAGCQSNFPKLNSSVEKTVIPQAITATPADYAQGGANSLAILLTDRNSTWLGLVHGLKVMGIPFIVTEDWEIAVKHRVVLVYPVLSGKVLPQAALRQLAAHPRNNKGLLVAFNVLGGGLEPVFGMLQSRSSSSHFLMKFSAEESLHNRFSDTLEQEIRLGNPTYQANAIGTYDYTADNGQVLARYEDDSPAIIGREFDSGGAAIAVGVDFGDFMQRGYNGRAELLTRSYVNSYEPATDVMLRWIRNLYVRFEPLAVTLRVPPQGKELAVMLTHDIDYTKSLTNALAYAEYEKSQGIRATYFIQTKYIKDWSDEIIFNEAGAKIIAKLARSGAEIGSHSVSHSKTFRGFTLGSGEEQYANYRPFVQSFLDTRNGTILGELRVSKALLEGTVNQTVRSFRPGHLSNPVMLPQALAATGYRYSSSCTANDSLSHLPFQLNYSRGPDAETAIYEFPITLEDEHLPQLGSRLPQALALAERVALWGGIFVALIHTDVIGHKLAFEKGFVAALKERAWFGTIGEFGDYWAARDQIRMSAQQQQQTVTLQLHAPMAVDNLTLTVPGNWRLNGGNSRVRQHASGLIVIERLWGEGELSFAVAE